MTGLLKAAGSSIGKKQIVALSGVALVGFTMAHLAGNLLLFAGGEAFDAYASWLESQPWLPVAEVGLALVFLVHIGFAVRVTYENRRARPQRYAVAASSGGRSTASGTMMYSGAAVLVFLVVHLVNFRLAHAEREEAYGGSLYQLVVAKFQDPLYVIGYVLGVCLLAVHLSHGFQSAFRTWGLDHPEYTPLVRWCGAALAAITALGYSSLPVYSYFWAGPPS